MSCYDKGDVVWWWSKQSGPTSATRAVFVRHDSKKTGFPKEDCILAIRIHNYTHTFRWPLRYISKVKPRN